MTTEKAFKELSSQRGWFKLCGITSNQGTSLKYLFKKNKLRSQQIFELLEKAGYTHSEIVWQKS